MGYEIGDSIRINIRGKRNMGYVVEEDGIHRYQTIKMYQIDPGTDGRPRAVAEEVLDAFVELGAHVYSVNEVDEATSENSGSEIEIIYCTPGMTVRVGGTDFTILDTDYPSAMGQKGVFCLAKDILFNKAFDENNKNNWKDSSLREHLHNAFYKTFTIMTQEKYILPFERDLTSDDGLKDYGTCTDDVSLISDEEYRRYREYIPNKNGWWWTLTPYSTLPEYSRHARLVLTDGSRNFGNAYNGSRGVSPAFLFLPSLKVRVIDEKEESDNNEN